MLKRNRQTKIVATLGPASADIDMIRQLALTGVDVFRLNFSHGSHEDHAARVKIIRQIEDETGHMFGIIADLQGPKHRVGQFKEGKIALTQGMTLRFDLDDTPGDETRVCLPHPEVINALKPGHDILLDDGKVRVRVVGKGSDHLDVEVINGSKLSNNKGFNVPGTIIPVPALTEKDLVDLEAAIDMGVDWIAQSFVQTPADVRFAKEKIKGRAWLMIKLEKPSALQHLDEMIALANGVMLARGDLGVEIPPEDVPAAQKRVVRAVRHAGKPIVVATQMLESMIDNPRPTRAEASDVATAVYDGTDAVMLSAETAAGAYPVEAVTIMDKICCKTEKDEQYRRLMEQDLPGGDTDVSDAITNAADRVAKEVKAAAITNYTSSGFTTLRTARQRPPMPIICLTHDEGVARRLCVSFGVYPVYTRDVSTFAEAVIEAVNVSTEKKFAEKGQQVVITAGVPFGRAGTTNALRIATID